MADDDFVRVMCDFSAWGLWDRRGAALRPERLNLSPALTLALRAWQGHYDEYEPGLTGQHFDWERFEETGRAICKLVQIERPDLHIVYGNDE
jgi:hypothetical protein